MKESPHNRVGFHPRHFPSDKPLHRSKVETMPQRLVTWMCDGCADVLYQDVRNHPVFSSTRFIVCCFFVLVGICSIELDV